MTREIHVVLARELEVFVYSDSALRSGSTQQPVKQECLYVVFSFLFSILAELVCSSAATVFELILRTLRFMKLPYELLLNCFLFAARALIAHCLHL